MVVATLRPGFHKLVFEFMENDIRRELWHFERTEAAVAKGEDPGPYSGAGNLLAALGLLCYTEVLGSFISGRKGNGWSKANFLWGYRKLGPEYRALMDTGEKLDVYAVYRCGLAHEYLAKEPAIYAMQLKPGAPLRCAIGRQSQGVLYFAVRQYLDDLMAVAQRIYDHPTLGEPIDSGKRATDTEITGAATSGEDDGLL
jgi:hypothetical protein